jgi:hypothetical protein
MVPVTVCGSQVVGLNMNLGRSMSTRKVADVQRDTLEDRWQRIRLDRRLGRDRIHIQPGATTTVPRPNGAAYAGTTMLNENGAPLYGPARYTAVRVFPACGRNTGDVPAPAPTIT